MAISGLNRNCLYFTKNVFGWENSVKREKLRLPTPTIIMNRGRSRELFMSSWTCWISFGVPLVSRTKMLKV